MQLLILEASASRGDSEALNWKLPLLMDMPRYDDPGIREYGRPATRIQNALRDRCRSTVPVGAIHANGLGVSLPVLLPLVLHFAAEREEDPPGIPAFKHLRPGAIPELLTQASGYVSFMVS